MYSAHCPAAWDGRLDCSAPAILLRAKKSGRGASDSTNQRIENNALVSSSGLSGGARKVVYLVVSYSPVRGSAKDTRLRIHLDRQAEMVQTADGSPEEGAGRKDDDMSIKPHVGAHHTSARRRGAGDDGAPDLQAGDAPTGEVYGYDKRHGREAAWDVGVGHKPDALRTLSEPPGDSGAVPEGAVAAHLPRERRATCTAPAAPGHGTADWIAVPLQFFYAPRSQRCF